MGNYTSFSKVIAGTMGWGTDGKRLEKSRFAGLIESCLASGITTFDHADIYGGYLNETDFGVAFAELGMGRETVQLISKCGIRKPGPGVGIKHYDYSKEHIKVSVEASLRNLKTEYLDLLLLHRPSPLMHPEEVAEAVSGLYGKGMIRNFGVSNFSASEITLLESAVPVTANQIQFSLTFHEAMYDGSLDDIMIHGRMAMAWAPLGTVYKEQNAKTQLIRDVMAPMMDKYGATTDQLLLAWVMRHPAGIRPVIGTTRKDRLIASVRAAEIPLITEDWFTMLAAVQGHAVP